MTPETEPMVRLISSMCQKCGESYEREFNQAVRTAAEVRHMTANYVHGFLKEELKTRGGTRPDGTVFGHPVEHLEYVHCGGHPLYATEPVS